MLTQKKTTKRQRGFTLVEIMIVVTIIGILASLAVPAFQRARWKALETSVRNNLRQIWGAAQQHMLENGVDEVNVLDIIAWLPKNGNETGTNAGYTSVIQQVSDEDYDKIGIYDDDTITNYTTSESSADSITLPSSGAVLSEKTQGLIIQIGSDTNARYVKLRV